MGNLFVEFQNFLFKTSFDFRNSYQGEVVIWIFSIYCLIIAASILIIIFKYPVLYDYATYGEKREKRQKREEKKRIIPQTPWEEINAKLNSVNPNDWKVAVIEADKLLDETLASVGTPGFSMGDRLKNIVNADVGNNLDGVWNAHKTRNAIVHNPGFELTSEIARKAVKTLEDATKALGGK